MKNLFPGNFRLGLGVAALVAALDQLAKWWLLEVFLLPYRGVVEVFPFFNLVMVWNRGVSFGMMNSSGDIGRWFLMAVSLVIVTVLVLWLCRVKSRLLLLAIGLVIGGALGNLIDRARFGAVADFIELHAAGYAFYVFNIADSAISIGVALLLWDAIFDGEGKTSSPSATQ
jgi:signal peptidase II